MIKAGLEIVVEQTVEDRDHPPPQIPAFAVIGALWYRRTDSDTVSFPVKLRKGEQLEVKAQQTSAGLWRVVEVSNLPALLSTSKFRHFGERSEASEGMPPPPVR